MKFVMTRAPYRVMSTCLSWIQPHPHVAILRHLVNNLIIVRNHGDDEEDERDNKRALERQGDALIVKEPPQGGGSLTRIILSDSRQSENTINTHEYNTIY
jgi:hypothetical protein